MRCIKCGSYQVKVYGTRNDKAERRIYRRRRCMDCGMRWSTVELPVCDLQSASDLMAQAVKEVKGENGKKHHAGR